MDGNSATCRTLAISEVLQRVLSFVGISDNAQCARVSRHWSDLALDRVWCHLDEPLPLFEILSPFAREESAPDAVKLVSETS